MKLTSLRPGAVLAKISGEDKRQIFEKDVESSSGSIVSLITSLKADIEADEFYSQSVYVATVIGIADDIDHIKIGDIIVIDYLADTDDEKIAYVEGDDKVVLLDVNTKYHTEDRIAYASMNSRMDTYTWRKGDVESQSWIYAIFNNGNLTVNNDYLLLEHRDLTWEGKTSSGLISFFSEGDIVVRKVIKAPISSKVKAGDIIVTEAFALLERSIDIYNFDVIMELDVLAKLEIN